MVFQIRISPKHGHTLKESWDTSGYKIFTNTNEVWGERLDLPGVCIYVGFVGTATEGRFGLIKVT